MKAEETPEKGADVQFQVKASQRTGHSRCLGCLLLEGGLGKVKSCPKFPQF